jgi:hypothetical protein
VLLVGDLAEYGRDPGLYVDYRTDMIGTQVDDTDGVIAAIVEERFDLTPYDAFIDRHLGAPDGGASSRFVERFVPEVGERAAEPSAGQRNDPTVAVDRRLAP